MTLVTLILQGEETLREMFDGGDVEWRHTKWSRREGVNENKIETEVATYLSFGDRERPRQETDTQTRSGSGLHPLQVVYPKVVEPIYVLSPI